MSDEKTGLPEEQPVPENASPDEGTGVTEPFNPEDYVPKKDYANVQSWATKVAQENKEINELRAALQDPNSERFEEALGYFGLEAPQPEPDPNEYVDPYEQRIAQLEAKLTQSEQQAQQQAEQQKIDNALFEGLNSVQSEIGRDLEEKEIDLLASYAVMNPQEDGLPNVQAAWDLYHGLIDQQTAQVFKNRKNAPKPAAGGVETGKQPDLSTHANKLNYAIERLTALDSDE